MKINFLEIARQVIENNEDEIYSAIAELFEESLDASEIAEAIMPSASEIADLLAEAALEHFSS